MPPALLAFVVLGGLGLASMVAYALRGARPDRDTVGKGAHLFGGVGDFVLHWFMWAINPCVTGSVRFGLTPDFYNYAGLGLGATIADSKLIVTGPLGYLAFLGLESAAQFVLTDSGGVQEETSALGVPCFTLRSTTERPITIELGTNTLLGVAPE